MGFRSVLWAGVVCSCLAGLGRADVLYLTNGNTLTGRVVSEDEERVVVETPHSLLTLPARSVVRIERQDPSELARGLITEALHDRRYQRALAYAKRAAKEHPDDPEFGRLLARAYAQGIDELTRQGLYDEAAALAREGEEGSASPELLAPARRELASQRKQFEELWASAGGSVEVGRYEQALGSYQKLLELAPGRRKELSSALAEAYVQYGDSFFRVEKYSEAVPRYEEALRLDPEVLPAVHMKLIAGVLTEVNHELEQANGPLPKERAMELFRRLHDLLQLEPDLPHIHLLLGLVYEHLGRPKLALSKYQQVAGEPAPGRSLQERLAAARKQAQQVISRTPLRIDVVTKTEDWSYAEPGDWQVEDSEHFRLFHHNPRVSAKLLAAAEFHLKREAPFFGVAPEAPWPGRCDIFLYPTAEEFQKATGRPGWSAAVSQLSPGPLGVGRLTMQTHQEVKLLGQTIVPHELGHLLLARVTEYARDLPLWLQEGVAVSQEPRFKLIYLLRDVATHRENDTALSLDAVLDLTDYPGEGDVNQYYGLCYLAVDVLLSRADFETLRRFALEARGGLEPALGKHYGLSRKEFLAAWEEHLKQSLEAVAPESATRLR